MDICDMEEDILGISFLQTKPNKIFTNYIFKSRQQTEQVSFLWYLIFIFRIWFDEKFFM